LNTAVYSFCGYKHLYYSYVRKEGKLKNVCHYGEVHFETEA